MCETEHLEMVIKHPSLFVLLFIKESNSIPQYCTHSLWVLRLLQEGGELQHSQLGAGNTSTLPRGGTRRHGQPCCTFIA